MNKIGIVGTGLIGGSFALAIKEVRKDVEIVGFDSSITNLRKALELQVIDQAADNLDELVSAVDLIVLTVPVNAILKLLPEILNKINEDQLVVDFGSTKDKICQTVQRHPKRTQYIAAHPIAGTEYSGPDAAFPGLYKGKTMIICDKEQSGLSQIEVFNEICQMLDMKLTYLSSKDHDVHLAYVSHLSHAISYSLSNVVLEKEKEDSRIMELAGSGFDSTVRLAKSSPEMWTPIFLDNDKNVIEGITEMIQQLENLKGFLMKGQVDNINEMLEKARKIIKILK